MDLLSLPTEMLTSVLKHSSFDSLVQMRKMSSRIDAVSGKYKFDCRKFNQMLITSPRDRTMVILQYDNEPLGKIFRSHKNESLSKILQFYFTKMLSVMCITGKGEPDHLIITKDIAEIFLKFANLKLSTLSLQNCELKFDAKFLNKILRTLNLMNFTLNAVVNDEKNTPFTDEIFDELKLPIIRLRPMNQSYRSSLSLKCIEKFCERSQPSVLHLIRLKINVVDLAKFLEKNLNVWAVRINQWEFIVENGAMDRNESIELITKLNCLNRYEIKTSVKDSLTVFYIYKQETVINSSSWFLYIKITY